MSKLINLDDFTLNEAQFNKVVSKLKELKRIVVPNGRQYVDFRFDPIPTYKDVSDSLDDEDDMLPTVNLQLVADYKLEYVSGLQEEYTESQSSVIGNRYNVQVCELPSAVRFTMLLATEIDKILKDAFKEDKIVPATVVDMDFVQNGNLFTEFLTLTASISLMQR